MAGGACRRSRWPGVTTPWRWCSAIWTRCPRPTRTRWWRSAASTACSAICSRATRARCTGCGRKRARNGSTTAIRKRTWKWPSTRRTSPRSTRRSTAAWCPWHWNCWRCRRTTRCWTCSAAWATSPSPPRVAPPGWWAWRPATPWCGAATRTPAATAWKMWPSTPGIWTASPRASPGPASATSGCCWTRRAAVPWKWCA